VLYQLGHHDDALEHNKKALEIRQRVLPPDHPDIAKTQAAIAHIREERDCG
jgi:hypothetical protein